MNSERSTYVATVCASFSRCLAACASVCNTHSVQESEMDTIESCLLREQQNMLNLPESYQYEQPKYTHCSSLISARSHNRSDICSLLGAVYANDIYTLEEILAEGTIDIHQPCPITRLTALTLAHRKGHGEIEAMLREYDRS